MLAPDSDSPPVVAGRMEAILGFAKNVSLGVGGNLAGVPSYVLAVMIESQAGRENDLISLLGSTWVFTAKRPVEEYLIGINAECLVEAVYAAIEDLHGGRVMLQSILSWKILFWSR